jgi:hypothetical protein
MVEHFRHMKNNKNILLKWMYLRHVNYISMKLLFKKMWGFGEDGEKKRRLNETKELK